MHAKELDPATHQRIADLAEEGNALADAGDFEGALSAFRAAVSLIPSPIHDWEAATWLFTAIGDVLFLKGAFAESQYYLEQALRCPDAVGNPFIHLRLGQACFELGDMDCAGDQLARAYMTGGDEIFHEEAPKYQEFVRSLLRPWQSH